jgi:anti-repressor protein
MEVIRMDELIRINFDSDRPTVSGRDLHAALEVKTAYKDWFPRMCDYGFEEGTDFCSFLSESTGGRPATDHQLTIAMAKELCMIQHSDAGRKFRQYFIKVEEAWNSPEAVMARALQFANNQLSLVKKQNLELLETVAVQNQQIAEMQPKASYYDLILQNKNTVPITQIAKDYGMSGRKFNELLHELGVQYKFRKTWLLYQHYAECGYTQSRTYAIDESRSVMHTYWTQKGRLFLYDLLKSEGILPVIEQED